VERAVEDAADDQRKRSHGVASAQPTPPPSPAAARTPPLYLQHEGHSRSLVGVLRCPPRLLIRDSQDALHRIRCVPPAALDGEQYQIVGVLASALSDAQALGRRGEDPMAAAVFDKGCWEHAVGLCPFRFDKLAS